MRSLLAAVMLGVTLAPVPSLARARAVAPAGEVDKLVALMVPPDVMVRISERVFDNNLRNGTALPPERQALFAANPGLKEHLSRALKAEMGSILRKDLPAFHVELAGLFTREMSAAEIGQTLAFFDGPTGRKMLARMYDGVARSTSETPDQAKQAAMASLMASLTAEDYPALTAFGATPAATKLQAVTPKLQQLAQGWATRLMAGNQARMALLADKATADYLAKKQ